MKLGFYLRLAIDGMRKNSRLYVPYLLTCSGMVTIFYILGGLSHTQVIKTMRGGDTIGMVLTLGCIVLAVFSAIFLFYANSFLVRRRNKEFGLYNILGMNKVNISRILVIETTLTALVSLIVGLAVGLLLSKLAELILVRMAGEVSGYSLWIDPSSLIVTVIVFGVIFALLLLVSLARISLSKPLDLLRSEATGEKPPKANFLFALAGLLILGAAYYMALSIETPLAAIGVFFTAVLMVIIATYLLFVAGSVALCRLLQKNKKYYYRPEHFVSVSSMVFRMKRNGAGLASICVLATMVLVMLSSTSCLYFGGEGHVRGYYPYDIMVRVRYEDASECSATSLSAISTAVLKETNGHEKNAVSYSVFSTDGLLTDGVINVNGVDRKKNAELIFNNVRSVSIISLSDYNRIAGTDVTLAENEALVWSSDKPYSAKTIGFDGCPTVKNVKVIKKLPIKISTGQTIVTLLVMVVPDWEEYTGEITRYIDKLNEGFESSLIYGTYEQYCCFDLSGVNEGSQIEMAGRIEKNTSSTSSVSYLWLSADSFAENKIEFFGMYGSMFFLGIALSIVFMAAAALIIYYKQLSEGYEDQGRFCIMQKVGMTGHEIKKTVESQVLTVFFAPLILAGIHLAFAFPFVNKILDIIASSDTVLLMITNISCFLLFALFYIFVYRQTARAYYNIVSDRDVNRQ